MPTGRPHITAYDALAKNCEQCGAVFGLRDRKFQSRAKFEKRRFCSVQCLHSAQSGEPVARFWANVERGQGCWNWQGRVGHNGYGQFSHEGKESRAHRFAYQAMVGPIPAGMMVLHNCDNRRCVNPKHLRVGTAKDNWRDAIERGRVTPFAGNKSAQAAA